ncbi:MAG: glutaredoxin family protein [Legionella sp.]
MSRVTALLMAFLGLYSMAIGMGAVAAPVSHGEKPIQLSVDLFLSSTCVHCQKADVFFAQLQKKKPWILINRHWINKDKKALHAFHQRLQEVNSTNYAVPAIFFCETHWIGFASAELDGNALMHGLDICRQDIINEGLLSDTTKEVLRQQSLASQVHLKAQKNSNSMILISTALMDAIASCSLFNLLLLLSFLWLYSADLKIQCILGITFIVASSVAHGLMQLFPALYLSDGLRIISAMTSIGLFAYLFWYYANYLKGTVSSYMFLVTPLFFLITMIAYLYQQGCSASITLSFEQWMDNMQFTGLYRLFYRMAYLCITLLPSSLFLVIYLYISKKKWSIWHARLQGCGFAALIWISIILLIYPQCLANLLLSMVSVVSILLMARYVERVMDIKN